MPTNPKPFRWPEDVNEAVKLKKEIRDRYDNGETINDLTQSYGLTRDGIKTAIEQSGGKIRSRGGDMRNRPRQDNQG